MSNSEKPTNNDTEFQNTIQQMGPDDIRSFYDVDSHGTMKTGKLCRLIAEPGIDDQRFQAIEELIDAQITLRIIELMKSGHFPALSAEAEAENVDSFIAGLVHGNKQRLKTLLK